MASLEYVKEGYFRSGDEDLTKWTLSEAFYDLSDILSVPCVAIPDTGYIQQTINKNENNDINISVGYGYPTYNASSSEIYTEEPAYVSVLIKYKDINGVEKENTLEILPLNFFNKGLVRLTASGITGLVQRSLKLLVGTVTENTINTILLKIVNNSGARLEIYSVSIYTELPSSNFDSVAVATTVNITLANEQTIGTINVVEGDRVLVAAQTVPAENGIYIVKDAAAWIRATDMDTEEKCISGRQIFVEPGDGSTGAITYVLSTPPPPQLDTDNIEFQRLGAGGLNFDIYQQDAAPDNPEEGDLWIDTDSVLTKSFGNIILFDTGTNDMVLTNYNTNLYLKQLPTVTAKQIGFNFLIPRSYASGTNLTLVVYMLLDSTTTGTVKCDLKYSLVNYNNTMGSPSTVSVSQAGPGITNRVFKLEFTISGSAKVYSSILVGTLMFLATGSFTGNAYLLGVELFGTSDKPGVIV